MPGPPPKPPHLRQRQNRHSTHAILPRPEDTADNVVPPLPAREKSTEVWHPKVLEWWASVWTSPMSAEYLGPDVLGGLYLLAELHQKRWQATDSKELVALAAEIRQQEVRFGLSPIDRRRLQWEVERGEKAADRLDSRRKARELPAMTGEDPRNVLKAV